MFKFLNKFSWTVRTPICHGRGSFYTSFENATPACSRGSVCPLRNISRYKERIRGDGKNDKVLVSALDVINVYTTGNKDDIHVSSYQKCKFHSSSTYSTNRGGYGEYQDPEKRRANILIFMTVLLVISLIWGNYKMDMSPYDKPAQKAEKL